MRSLLALLLSVALIGAAPVRAADEPPPPPPSDEGAAPPPPPDEAPAPPGAAEPTPPPEGEAETPPAATPPRLSYLYGEVSFWRPGAEDWAPAHVNTPLAAGDELYAGQGANLELQTGARAFVRAGAGSNLGIEDVEPDFLQLKLTGGHLALDLRTLERGHTIEVDTPNAAFRVERSGYFRIDVDDDGGTFITRRGGAATLIPTGGEAIPMAAGEEVTVEGTDSTQGQHYRAPDLDPWDRWNYQRTDRLLEPRSARYVPEGVYGTDDLDRNGTWRDEPRYGHVWVPSGVAADWAPYTTGRWIWDPYYGWTWIDDAPWGWAPYHYGRWVYAGGGWGWAPGPVVVAPVYAPALVAFFGGGGVSVGIGVGAPVVSWVALGWGEPCIPWWGPSVFVGRPWWGGWGGPRVVNNVVINKTTIVNVNRITTYQNTRVRNAIVGTPQDRFGRAGGRENRVRLGPDAVRRLQPVRGSLPVKPAAASLVPAAGHAARPPDRVANRRVVATRAPRDPSGNLRAAGLAPRAAAPAPRLVQAPASRPAGTPRAAGGERRGNTRGGQPEAAGRSEAGRPAPPGSPGRVGRPGAPRTPTAERGTASRPSAPAGRQAPGEAERPAPRQSGSGVERPAARQPGSGVERPAARQSPPAVERPAPRQSPSAVERPAAPRQAPSSGERPAARQGPPSAVERSAPRGPGAAEPGVRGRQPGYAPPMARAPEPRAGRVAPPPPPHPEGLPPSRSVGGGVPGAPRGSAGRATRGRGRE